jgi:hypothetical protein
MSVSALCYKDRYSLSDEGYPVCARYRTAAMPVTEASMPRLRFVPKTSDTGLGKLRSASDFFSKLRGYLEKLEVSFEACGSNSKNQA